MSKIVKVCLRELNPHLVCVLCGGYLIEATTIQQCLHSFCKSCLWRYLETSKVCPICDVQVHKVGPLTNIREDQTLQDVVYKMVPGLYQNEMARRREYYATHTDQTDSEDSLDSYSSNDIRLSLQHNHKFPDVLRHDDDVSICLLLSDRPPSYRNGSIKKSSKQETILDRRYLLCPAQFPINLLKKFIKGKFELSDVHEVSVYHRDEPLAGNCTLKDVCYIYNWNKCDPLKLYYTVTEMPHLYNQSTFLLKKKQRAEKHSSKSFHDVGYSKSCKLKRKLDQNAKCSSIAERRHSDSVCIHRHQHSKTSSKKIKRIKKLTSDSLHHRKLLVKQTNRQMTCKKESKPYMTKSVSNTSEPVKRKVKSFTHSQQQHMNLSVRTEIKYSSKLRSKLKANMYHRSQNIKQECKGLSQNRSQVLYACNRSKSNKLQSDTSNSTKSLPKNRNETEGKCKDSSNAPVHIESNDNQHESDIETAKSYQESDNIQMPVSCTNVKSNILNNSVCDKTNYESPIKVSEDIITSECVTIKSTSSSVLTLDQSPAISSQCSDITSQITSIIDLTDKETLTPERSYTEIKNLSYDTPTSQSHSMPYNPISDQYQNSSPKNTNNKQVHICHTTATLSEKETSKHTMSQTSSNDNMHGKTAIKMMQSKTQSDEIICVTTSDVKQTEKPVRVLQSDYDTKLPLLESSCGKTIIEEYSPKSGQICKPAIQSTSSKTSIQVLSTVPTQTSMGTVANTRSEHSTKATCATSSHIPQSSTICITEKEQKQTFDISIDDLQSQPVLCNVSSTQTVNVCDILSSRNITQTTGMIEVTQADPHPSYNIPITLSTPQPVSSDVLPITLSTPQPVSSDVLPITLSTPQPVSSDVLPITLSTPQPVSSDVLPITLSTPQPISSDVLPKQRINKLTPCVGMVTSISDVAPTGNISCSLESTSSISKSTNMLHKSTPCSPLDISLNVVSESYETNVWGDDSDHPMEICTDTESTAESEEDNSNNSNMRHSKPIKQYSHNVQHNGNGNYSDTNNRRENHTNNEKCENIVTQSKKKPETHQDRCDSPPHNVLQSTLQDGSFKSKQQYSTQSTKTSTASNDNNSTELTRSKHVSPPGVTEYELTVDKGNKSDFNTGTIDQGDNVGKAVKSVEVQTDVATIQSGISSAINKGQVFTINGTNRIPDSNDVNNTVITSHEYLNSHQGQISPKFDISNESKKLSSSQSFAKKYRCPTKLGRQQDKNSLSKGDKFKQNRKSSQDNSDPYLFTADDNHNYVNGKAEYVDNYTGTESRNALAFLEEYVNYVHKSHVNQDESQKYRVESSNGCLPTGNSGTMVKTSPVIVGNMPFPKAYIPLKDIASAAAVQRKRAKSEGSPITASNTIPLVNGKHNIKNLSHNNATRVDIRNGIRKIPPLKLKLPKPGVVSTEQCKKASPELKVSKQSKNMLNNDCKSKKDTQLMTGNHIKYSKSADCSVSPDEGQPRIFLRISKANIPSLNLINDSCSHTGIGIDKEYGTLQYVNSTSTETNLVASINNSTPSASEANVATSYAELKSSGPTLPDIKAVTERKINNPSINISTKAKQKEEYQERENLSQQNLHGGKKELEKMQEMEEFPSRLSCMQPAKIRSKKLQRSVSLPEITCCSNEVKTSGSCTSMKTWAPRLVKSHVSVITTPSTTNDIPSLQTQNTFEMKNNCGKTMSTLCSGHVIGGETCMSSNTSKVISSTVSTPSASHMITKRRVSSSVSKSVLSKTLGSPNGPNFVQFPCFSKEDSIEVSTSNKALNSPNLCDLSKKASNDGNQTKAMANVSTKSLCANTNDRKTDKTDRPGLSELASTSQIVQMVMSAKPLESQANSSNTSQIITSSGQRLGKSKSGLQSLTLQATMDFSKGGVSVQPFTLQSTGSKGIHGGENKLQPLLLNDITTVSGSQLINKVPKELMPTPVTSLIPIVSIAGASVQQNLVIGNAMSGPSSQIINPNKRKISALHAVGPAKIIRLPVNTKLQGENLQINLCALQNTLVDANNIQIPVEKGQIIKDKLKTAVEIENRSIATKSGLFNGKFHKNSGTICNLLENKSKTDTNKNYSKVQSSTICTPSSQTLPITRSEAMSSPQAAAAALISLSQFPVTMTARPPSSISSNKIADIPISSTNTAHSLNATRLFPNTCSSASVSSKSSNVKTRFLRPTTYSSTVTSDTACKTVCTSSEMACSVISPVSPVTKAIPKTQKVSSATSISQSSSFSANSTPATLATSPSTSLSSIPVISPFVPITGLYVGARHYLPPHISYHGFIYPASGVIMVNGQPRVGVQPPQIVARPPKAAQTTHLPSVAAVNNSVPIQKSQMSMVEQVKDPIAVTTVHQPIVLQQIGVSQPVSIPQANGYDAPLELTKKKCLISNRSELN